ncbi:MAG: hypothetical protein ACXVHT_02775 [Methanobacterium sp.]
MGLKSLEDRNILVKESIDYSDSKESVLYKGHLLKKDFNSLNDLETLIRNSMQYTNDQELKLGLEIILAIISHKNEYVRAYAIGKIYFFIEDELIKEIIVKELKNMLNSRNEDINDLAQCSLDLIALEVHKFRIFEVILDILNYSWEMIKFSIIPYLEKIDNIDDENLIEEEIIPHIIQLELNKKGATKKLANFYVRTFREKGHVRRLIALLDVEDKYTKEVGIDALMKVLKVLLTPQKR